MRFTSLPALLATGLLASLLVAVGPPAAHAATICSGVPNCKVVARVDVDGDGRRDVVALGSRRLDSPNEKRIIVRVRQASGATVTARRHAEWVAGGLWRGAGRIDGRPGRELVIRGLTGAHATFSYVLTWRKGRLVSLRSPHGDRLWAADAAAMIVIGWHRAKDERPGLLRFREASAQRPGGPWTGSSTTYRWTTSGWRELGVTRVENATTERLDSWGGWHIPGVRRF
jgi:hypothetical protein